MGPRNKPNRKGSKRIKCKDICDDTQGRRSVKPIAGQTTQSRLNCGIKVKIYSTMFLYFQKRWFIIVSSGLQKAQLSHNKEQNPIIFNWRSN